MELTDILKIEATNRRHIYLYHHKGKVWGCCGRSAILLHRLYPNISYTEKDISGMGDILPVMIIHPFTLEHLIENIPPIEQEKEMFVIEIPESWTIYLK